MKYCHAIEWGLSHTLARSYLRARKTLRFLKDLNSSMSSGKLHTSLKLASSRTGLPELRVKMGLQMKAFLSCSPPASLEVLMEVDFFNCPFTVRASLARGWWEDYVISLSSVPSALLPHWALFLFLSTASIGDVCVAGLGGHVTADMAREEPPAWAMRRASRSRVFSSKPIAVEV